MTEEQYEEAKMAIYARAREIEQNDEYADPQEAAECFKECALDILDSQYYGEDY